MTENFETAYKSALNNNKIIKSLSLVSKYVPGNECIYSIQTPFVMLYTNRKSILIPNNIHSFDEFKKQTVSCNYFIAMPMSGSMINLQLYYPLDIIKNKPEYIVTPIPIESNGIIETIIFLIKKNY